MLVCTRTMGIYEVCKMSIRSSSQRLFVLALLRTTFPQITARSMSSSKKRKRSASLAQPPEEGQGGGAEQSDTLTSTDLMWYAFSTVHTCC